ncbi:MAG: protein tyrosine phosphatase family protein [Candidatus Thiodiazotropha lotti]|nr:protein tyrosine phosphatase family protein [Candidatus Thiodiazotropha lotti]
MAIENIINYLRISDRIASSGQPDEAQFKAIAQAGFQVVINLAMPNSDHAIPEEGYIVTARKMSYVHIPVPFDAPDAEHLKTFVGFMEGVQDKKCLDTLCRQQTCVGFSLSLSKTGARFVT